MVDIYTKAERSERMSRIKARNTLPERRVKSILQRLSFRFPKRRTELPGKPDVVLARYKTAVFVHGCFWHRHEGFKHFKMPPTKFWRNKIIGNVKRDGLVQAALRAQKWRVLVIWECVTKTRNGRKVLAENLATWLRDKRKKYGEFPPRQANARLR